MKALVVGATGQVGNALRARLGDAADYWSSTDVDLRDESALRDRVKASSPGLLVNCAAYNSVDRAESEPDAAMAVNATAVGAMAEAAAAVGARFVTYSTDYVFDGAATEPYTESARPGPLSAYGRSKLEGEGLALSAHPDCLVIRTSWVMSARPNQFADLVLRVARDGGGRFVDDQVGTPTLATDLADATLVALDKGVSGLLHLANTPVLSRFELARQIVGMAGLDPELIQPCSSEDLGAAAARPAYSALASERLTGLGIEPLGDYSEGLGIAVRELAG